MVTFAGSPPNAAMLFCTHCRAKRWSKKPTFRDVNGISGDPEKPNTIPKVSRYYFHCHRQNVACNRISSEDDELNLRRLLKSYRKRPTRMSNKAPQYVREDIQICNDRGDAAERARGSCRGKYSKQRRHTVGAVVWCYNDDVLVCCEARTII